jgi:hypothetical protein
MRSNANKQWEERERWGYKNTNDDLRVCVAREEEEEEKRCRYKSHETVCVSNKKKKMMWRKWERKESIYLGN